MPKSSAPVVTFPVSWVSDLYAFVTKRERDVHRRAEREFPDCVTHVSI